MIAKLELGQRLLRSSKSGSGGLKIESKENAPTKVPPHWGQTGLPQSLALLVKAAQVHALADLLRG
jgi:hypothetical protein